MATKQTSSIWGWQRIKKPLSGEKMSQKPWKSLPAGNQIMQDQTAPKPDRSVIKNSSTSRQARKRTTVPQDRSQAPWSLANVRNLEEWNNASTRMRPYTKRENKPILACIGHTTDGRLPTSLSKHASRGFIS